MTSVCSDKDVGKPEDIIIEIEKRDKSFEYYSILLRKEKDENILEYEWFIIPKDYYIFNLKKYGLEPKIGKQGKNKEKQVGWENKYCEIRFSMSSQLWLSFEYDKIKKYKVCSVEIDKTKIPKINYSDLIKMLNLLNI